MPATEITHHTTASSPRPHILYNVRVKRADGGEDNFLRRYSDFIALHSTLQDPFSLPPKRILTTTFVPSAWADDFLIAERKAGLTSYLLSLQQSAEHNSSQALLDFLTKSPTLDASPSQAALNGGRDGDEASPEDYLPSTFSRKDALAMKAALLEGNDAPACAIPRVDRTQALAAAGEEGLAPKAVTAGYYPDWSEGSRPPEGLDYSKWDILFFAFAMPSSSAGLTLNSGTTLRRLVASAKASNKGTKIVLSVGGWGGCKYFSYACSTAALRTKFATALKAAVDTYQLDGIDLDWEYPNAVGAGNGQGRSPQDTANYLKLMQMLRTSMGPNKIISSAVPHQPWLGSDGAPSKDVKKFAEVMTYVNIMNYDVWGSSATPGANAPLGDLCGTSRLPHHSAAGSLKAWTAAGFPASKLLLGLALYGYVSKSTKTVLTGSFAPEERGNGLALANGSGSTLKTLAAKGDLSSFWGSQVAFNQLLSSGAMVKKADGTYGGGAGYTFAWDDCSDTPYLYNKSRSTVVTYDDTWSLTDKAKFARQNGMAGCFTWSIDQDDGYALQNVIRKALGR
ncbi:glycoside hydrolase family 18 protein [Pterulicium gracile]|uniref:Glycoside hydrolase family 18 protein n=1 Tax=Pterulicium gracile TaxID=1884261 RepID=A0A5C3QX99_9AGAR|nr:glycoside hydrolase family 18 protein [Pterula gracilis]